MRISQLDGRRVALWGWGREGRASYRALRAASQAAGTAPLPLTLFCDPSEAAQAEGLGDPALRIQTQISAAALAAFEVVIKSPGISPYCAQAQAAAEAGTRFVGGTALWFAEQGCAEHAQPDGVVSGTVCVTGTKGKSTTTALLAHVLRAGGHRTALAGNIGLPLLEVLAPVPRPAYWAIELSSYQTGEVVRSGARPELAMVLNVFPEHLDWHGGEARYVQDKLSLVTAGRPRIALLNAADPRLAGLQLPHSQVRWFNCADGWHMRGEVVYCGEDAVFDAVAVPLPGPHNRANLCAVLAAVDALGLDAAALAPSVLRFRPLPNRLQMLGTRDGLVYVNDSISTTPYATLAALDCFQGCRVALLVGGHDRGLDWQVFADRMTRQAPVAIITMGANGPRIHDLLAPLAVRHGVALYAAAGLSQAVALARTALDPLGGVVLLSPGAPSFGDYTDYVARGRRFAQLAGFDPDTISAIPGLGIA